MNIASTVLLADTWGMHGDDVGTGWMVVMMVAMLLFWAAIIVGVVLLARGSFEGWRRREGPRVTPSEILERRFAEGAISAEEYQERREVIAREAVAFEEAPATISKRRRARVEGAKP